MTYARDGFEIVRNALSPHACDALREAAGTHDSISMPHLPLPPFKVAMVALAPHARSKIGNSISGLGSDYFSVSAGFATHTDNDYVQALPGTFMSIWLPLVDVTIENGPLVIGGQAILCSKGDALLIDGDTPHRSCAGRGPRPVALFTYIQRGKPFRPGKTQMRAEVAL